MLEKINEGIKAAMRSRDQVRLETLRMLKSRILAVDARGNLPDAEVVKLFKNYYGNLQESLGHAQSANRSDLVDQLKKEMEIVQEFLPVALSEEETRQLVVQAINECQAKSRKDTGLVMKAVMKSGKEVDGKLVKEIVDQLLPC